MFYTREFSATTTARRSWNCTAGRRLLQSWTWHTRERKKKKTCSTVWPTYRGDNDTTTTALHAKRNKVSSGRLAGFCTILLLFNNNILIRYLRVRTIGKTRLLEYARRIGFICYFSRSRWLVWKITQCPSGYLLPPPPPPPLPLKSLIRPRVDRRTYRSKSNCVRYRLAATVILFQHKRIDERYLFFFFPFTHTHARAENSHKSTSNVHIPVSP